MEDNQGGVKDYANYFRKTETDLQEASRRGLLRGDKGRKGFIIGKNAGDDLYSLFRNDKIGQGKTARIASAQNKSKRKLMSVNNKDSLARMQGNRTYLPMKKDKSTQSSNPSSQPVRKTRPYLFVNEPEWYQPGAQYGQPHGRFPELETPPLYYPDSESTNKKTSS
jgi:hypothetical protein